MAANLQITQAATGGSPELLRSRRNIELVKITGTGAAVDDTGNYIVSSFTPVAAAGANPTFIIGGAFDITAVSGQQVTIRTKIALGTATNYVWIAEGL